MPSGVEERLPSRPKWEDMLAGLARPAGMVIARAKEGWGEGSRGRWDLRSPLRRDMIFYILQFFAKV